MNILIIEELQGHPLGLYDAHTDKSIYADKVIDVSELCKKCDMVLIMYGKDSNRTLAQIIDCYPGQDFGCTIHYGISGISAKQLAEHEIFYDRAIKILGANPYQLANAIINNKPQ